MVCFKIGGKLVVLIIWFIKAHLGFIDVNTLGLVGSSMKFLDFWDLIWVEFLG